MHSINERADRLFDESGIDPNFWPAIAQEAHYVGNHVGGRPSDNIARAIDWYERKGADSFTSPMARSLYEKATA